MIRCDMSTVWFRFWFGANSTGLLSDSLLLSKKMSLSVNDQTE